MNHGSLFSGIGGFDLAAEWMGWQNIFHCELNPFGRKVLHHYWPDAIQYHDITKTDFTVHRAHIDILTGGFPCQPYSAAGKRLGKEDDRHLWPEMLRAIREIQPRWIVGENVLGLVNWNRGLVFHEVQTDLETEGYQVQPYVLPAVSVNAPHRRDRVWFVAYSRHTESQRPTQFTSNNNTGSRKGKQKRYKPASCFGDGNVTSTNGRLDTRKEHRQKKPRQHTQTDTGSRWQNFPTQSPICGRNDGLPTQLDGITFSKWRNESIKAYGNAIVPQVVYQIFKSIQAYEN